MVVAGCVLMAAADAPPAPMGAQYLMVDQNGRFVPEGYAAGLSDIARAEAEAAAVAQAAIAVGQAANAASGVVDQVVGVLVGGVGFGYVQGYTVSVGGVLQVSTNASASIVYARFCQGVTNIGGVVHSEHHIYHVYSEPMNAMPAIKYRETLEGGEWQFVEFQQTEELRGETVNGRLYDVVYRSRVYLPAAYDSAFFLAFCEIVGGGGESGVFQVEGGFAIGGKEGFSGEVVREGRRWRYQCGALMEVLDE